MTHNKNTNVILVHNALLNRIAEAVIDGSPDVVRIAAIAKRIVKKHFGPTSVLREYRDVCQAITSANMIDRHRDTALAYMREVENHIASADWSSYDDAKDAFLSETRRYFDMKSLLSDKTPEYRTLAAVHLFTESCMGKRDIRLLEDKVKLCRSIVERLVHRDHFSRRLDEARALVEETGANQLSLLIASNEMKAKLATLSGKEKKIASIFVEETDALEISARLMVEVSEAIGRLRQVVASSTGDTRAIAAEAISNLSRLDEHIAPDILEDVAERLVDVFAFIDSIG